MTLEGKTILVTGASRGIGGAIASAALEAGAEVVTHYNSAEYNIADLKKKYGDDRVLALQADLIDTANTDKLWRLAVEWKGKLDGVVNNAALMSEDPPEGSLEDWRDGWSRTLAINVTAVADLCRYAILHFKERGGGRIVNIASRAAFRGDLPDSIHYAASKGAVVALTRSIAKGYARDGILAFTVAPGWVASERVLPRITAPENAFMINEIPLGRPADVREVGEIVTFFLGADIPSATGATFDINGASYFH